MFNPKQRLTQAIGWRVEERIAPLRAEVDRLGHRLDRLERDLGAPLERVSQDYVRLRDDVARLYPQVDAIEVRLGAGPEAPPAADALREHERARLRSQIISQYEERIRRLERALADRAD